MAQTPPIPRAARRVSRHMAANPLANTRDGIVAATTGEVLLEVRKGCGHDVPMMNLRADGLDSLQPQPVNPLDVLRGQIRRVRAERKPLHLPTRGVHGET